jgi:hypothetical protein
MPDRILAWVLALIAFPLVFPLPGYPAERAGAFQVKVVGPQVAGAELVERDFVLELKREGEPPRTITIPASLLDRELLAFAQTGEILIALGKTGSGPQIHRMSIASGKVLDTFRVMEEELFVSPDSTWLAFTEFRPTGPSQSGDVCMVLELASGKAIHIFPESDALTGTSETGLQDARFFEETARSFLWSADSKTVVLAARVEGNRDKAYVVAIDVSGLPASKPRIARRLLAKPFSSRVRTSGPVAVESLEWSQGGQVRASVEAGGRRSMVDVPLPEFGPQPVGELGPEIFDSGEIQGLSVASSGYFRWFSGITPEGTLTFVDGRRYLLGDKLARCFVEVRLGMFSDAGTAQRAVGFLPKEYLGLGSFQVNPDRDIACPADSCAFVSNNGLLTLVFRSARTVAWLDARGGGGLPEAQLRADSPECHRLLYAVAEVIIGKAGGRQ